MTLMMGHRTGEEVLHCGPRVIDPGESASLSVHPQVVFRPEALVLFAAHPRVGWIEEREMSLSLHDDRFAAMVRASGLHVRSLEFLRGAHVREGFGGPSDETLSRLNLNLKEVAVDRYGPIVDLSAVEQRTLVVAQELRCHVENRSSQPWKVVLDVVGVAAF